MEAKSRNPGFFIPSFFGVNMANGSFNQTMRLSEFKNLIANMPVPYQAFASKRATWKKHIAGDNEAGAALHAIFEKSDEVTLSRSDLRHLASKPDLAQFVMATIIWGYPQGMRGNHVENMMGHFGELKKLLVDAKTQPVA
ncbi:MAG: hypothetical protein COW70_11970 [Hydrogenophilales bacterium CG18_big_fil_WC_8_21_14_2_50_58_12]|nr:MAG: hypothetical protein COW70_11970 [Hydrogenophilales bacterium CG18_big_fil_WC_8_21_14_2_50_58_12]